MWALFWNVTTLGRDLTDEELGFISYENELMGLVQLRQVRVRNSSCTVHPYFKKFVPECIASYSSSVESTDSYGPENWFAYTLYILTYLYALAKKLVFITEYEHKIRLSFQTSDFTYNVLSFFAFRRLLTTMGSIFSDLS